MNIGSLQIELLANVARLQKDMDDAKRAVGGAMANIEKTVESAKVALGALGAGLSAGMFVDMIRGSIDAADNLNDLSKTTGIAVDQLAGLKLAAKQSGGDLDGIAASINKLSVAMAKDAEKFAKLGVIAKEPLEAFKQLADIFSSIKDPQLRAALGAEALGKSWASAAPLLAEGGEKIGEMVIKGAQLSGVTKELTANADEFNDTLAEFEAVSAGAKMRLTADLLPAFTEVSKAVLQAYEDSGKLKAVWVGLGALGSAIFTDQFASSATKIKKLSVELAQLEQDLGLAKDAPAFGYVGRLLLGESPDALQNKIKQVQSEIDGLRASTVKPFEDPFGDKFLDLIDGSAKEAAKRAAEFVKSNEEKTKAQESFLKALQKEHDVLVLGNAQGKIQEAIALGITGAKLAQVKATLANIDAFKAEMKAAQDRAALRQKENEGIADYLRTTQEGHNADVKASRDALKAAQEEYAQFGLTKSQIADLTLKQLELRLSRYNDDSSPGKTATEQEIANQKELIAILQKGEARDEVVKNLETQKKLWETIESTAHDTFISIFNSGKSALDRLRDTLKNGLYELLYQMTLKKWLFNIGAAVSGSGAGGVGGAVGAATGIGNVANAASGAYGLFQAGGALAGGSLASVASGATYATSMLSQQSLMLAAQEASGATATALGGAADIAGVLAAIPGWGWAALGAAAIGAYLLNDGPESNTRLNFGSNNAAGAISINERGNEGKTGQSYIDGSGKSAFGTFGVVSSFWMNAAQPVVQDFIKTVNQTDDALAQFLTATEKASVSAYLTGKVSIANTGAEGANPNATGQLDKVFAERINNILEGVEPGLAALTTGFQGTSQQLATEAAALLQYRQALTDSGQAIFGAKVTLQEVAALKLPTESASAAITRVANVFKATDEVAKIMGETTEEAFGAVGLASYEARQHMIELAGGLQGLATIIGNLQQAQQNYDSAVSAAQGAMKSAADQYKQFVNAVTTAEHDVATARAAISSEYQSALKDDMNAKEAVADQQAQLTAGYLSASQKVVEAQRKVIDSFGRVGASLQEFLSSMDTSDIAGAATRDQLAASQARLAILAAQAKAGDLNAFDKIPAIASNILKLGQDNSATREEYARIVASVRSTVSDVAAFADSKVKAATPANDPKVVQLDELAAAIAEQKKWADAVAASGASFTTSTTSILDGYNSAVAAQVQATTAVGYWASIAQSTGTDIASASDQMSTLGKELIEGFFTAKTALEQAQNDLAAANAIKGGLELRQASALEGFVVAIKNVNTTAQTVLEAAGALFTAASNDLLVGTDLSNKAMLEAKDGMAYWGGVVSSTAKGIAESVSILSQNAAQNAAVAASNAAAAASTVAGATQAATNTTLIEGIYQSVLGRHSDATGLAFWVEAMAKGAITAANAAVEIAKGAAAQSEGMYGPHAADWTSALAMADDVKGTAYLKSLGIPGFAVGINSVPSDMLAMVHQGEEITPKPFVDLQRAARDETNDLLSRLLDSNEKLAAKVEALQAAAEKTAANTRETADATDGALTLAQQVVRGGLSVQTREADTDL